jgi:hypothetical protein
LVALLLRWKRKACQVLFQVLETVSDYCSSRFLTKSSPINGFKSGNASLSRHKIWRQSKHLLGRVSGCRFGPNEARVEFGPVRGDDAPCVSTGPLDDRLSAEVDNLPAQGGMRAHGSRRGFWDTVGSTRVQDIEIAEGQPVSIIADTLACAIDVSHRLDVEGLRRAYERVAHAKTLRKSPAARDILHTTITFGVIFAAESAVPLEHLADELDRLNQETPNAHWPDMVVVASHGVITYAVQFPGEPTISAGFLPPAAR